MSNLFYKAFEDKFRGSRDLIKSRLKAYLPFVLPLLQLYPKAEMIDLGCGRGEWLELTTEHGFQAQGVDIDEGMLQNARDLGFAVHNMDAVAFLQQLPDNSQSVISGFHIAEHITFEQLQQLVQQAKRVLVPGGLLILETPNPENLMVGACNFYLDPTHQRPIPPELLHFLPEHYGFARQKIIRLQEPPHLANNLNTTLLDVVRSVSPDYSVIAQTKAPAKALQAFDVPFSQNYGLTLHTLAERYEQNMSTQLELAESAAKAQLHQALQVAQTSQAQALNAEANAQLLQEQLHQALQVAQTSQAQLKEALQISQVVHQQMQNALAFAEHARQAENLNNCYRQDLSNKEAEIATMHQELHNIQQANHHHWLQLEQIRKEFHDLLESNHRHWQLAQQLEQFIKTMQLSWSWRLTWPIRLIGKFVLWPIQTIRTLTNQTIARGLNAFPQHLGKLMTKVLAHPKLTRHINHFLMRWPHLHGHLISIARNQGIIKNGTINSKFPTKEMHIENDNTTNLDHISPYAKKIYTELKSILEAQKNNNLN